MRRWPSQIPAEPGTYVMLLRLDKFRSLVIGRLGRIDFEAGWYAYVGSAMGPGGLAARIDRHYRRIKKKHWHIDYFRPETRMEGVYVVADPFRLEHMWAQCLGKMPLSGQPIPRFGASDCNCASHLYYYRQFTATDLMASVLKAQWIRRAGGSTNR